MLAGDQFDFSARQVGIGLGAHHHLSAHGQDRFLADALEQFRVGEGLVDHDLQQAFAVAQVDKGQAAQFAHVVHPAVNRDGPGRRVPSRTSPQ